MLFTFATSAVNVFRSRTFSTLPFRQICTFHRRLFPLHLHINSRFLATSSSPSSSSPSPASSPSSSSSTTGKVRNKLVTLSSLSPEELGPSILHPDANKFVRKRVIFAKVCSLGSSALGLAMLPVINSTLWQTIAERPAVLVFAGIANLFLSVFALTPLLLHFLTKRFVQNVFYNPQTKIFTTVHYNFFLQKRALRFTADEVMDAAEAPKDQKLWIPLATCLVHSRPMLLLLDANSYIDCEAFSQLTKNIRESPPEGTNPFIADDDEDGVRRR